MIETGTFLQQRYRIDKQIGQGGMGAVYVATDERFGSVVAIKETLCMDASFRKAIEREARLLNSLKHVALPRVTDHFEEDDSMFLVMEYIPGEDLCCVLDERGKPFPVDEMLKWGDQLLEALEFLHNQEIPVIHRDIKPQNLKLTPQGQVVLLDFGLAKGNPTDAGHNTAAKSIFGYSRNYASLEQIQGTGTDPRSDLYSLAATFYHLLTNTPPEDALTRAMAVVSQKPDPLVPASDINPAIPRGVAGVLQNALDLNASERPGSAGEMRKMLSGHEAYSHLAERVGLPTSPDKQIFAQQTKLMPDETRADGVKFTDMKTEVMPDYSLEKTSVIPGSSYGATSPTPVKFTSSPPENKKRLGVAAGALGMFLFGGIIAGGLYVADPAIFGSSGDVEKTANPNAAAAVTANSTDPANANATSVQVDPAATTDSNTANQSERVKQPETSEKPADTTKNTKATAKTKEQGNTGEEIVITEDDLDIPAGGVVITKRDENGKKITMRVNPAERPPNMRPPPPDGYGPFPPGIDPRRLTPEQRQRIKNAMRNGQRPPPPVSPDRP